MLENVLAVGRPVAQSTEERDEVGMHVGHAGLNEGVLPSAYTHLLDLSTTFFVLLLNTVRMNAPVEDEFLQCQPGDLPADRVKARQQHGFGRVIDDHINAGNL